jgi:hypothetical protein
MPPPTATALFVGLSSTAVCPPTSKQKHPPGPFGELLVPLALLFGVAFGVRPVGIEAARLKLV